MASKSSLRQLAELILASVDVVESAFEKNGAELPSLDTSANIEAEIAVGLAHPEAQQAITILLSATQQLMLTVDNPAKRMLQNSMMAYLPATIRIAAEMNITEILREAGPKGMHSKNIADKLGVDSGKLARILRFLAAQHIFTEVSPDVFANNRLSVVLDKGRSSAELLAKPDSLYDGEESCVAAAICHSADDTAKGAVYMFETLKDPKTSFSEEPTETSFNRGLNTPLTCWQWFEQPEQAFQAKRFDVAMAFVRKASPPHLIMQGFDWGSLPAGSLVVDVAGGVGTLSMELAKAHRHLNIILQDRATVIDTAKKFWADSCKEAVAEKRISFQVHNFFEEQPVKSPDVFILKAILHDWSDKYAMKILSALRPGAGPNTLLVVVEAIVPYATKPAEASVVIPGEEGKTLSTSPLRLPLIPGINPHFIDMEILNAHNGQERTVEHFQDLFGRTGWKLAQVKSTGFVGQMFASIVAVPA